MTYFMVDVEADGPIPGDYSMVSVGAIAVEPALDCTFYGRLRPISKRWLPEALSVSGFSREETFQFDDPPEVMNRFAEWIKSNTSGQPVFISDNNGFDLQFINWYFHHFCGRNPFGYSSQNLGSLYKGLVKNMSASFKHLRKTKHTHHPVDDARGNAEALLELQERYGLRISRKV
ncbi:MAG: 3'-5' exoribonuclease [Planctomycetes bacterium]|nr:3'-5' exoribonuclease [Planctomycetota bacterium]